MMQRQRIAAPLAFLYLLLLHGAWAAAGAEAVAPNIVVFLVDDMGVMDTSVPFLTDEDGHPQRYPLNDYYRTPSMERLAAQGIRLNQFYAMSVCSPTRISIMTGQNAARHRTTNWINPSSNNRGPKGPPDWNWTGLKPQDITLPGLLREAGYQTIHVGKAHFGPENTPGAEPLNLGFALNIGGASFGAPGSYYGEKNYGLGTRRAHHAVPHLDKYHGSETFLTEALTIEAKARLSKTVKSDAPFYLYMSHYAVHAPFDSDPRFAAHYVDSGKPKNAQAFATLIEGMDKSLGDLLDHLDELGVAENTLVFFLGDNGSDAPLGHQHAVACAAPLRGKKGAHYEGGMRVPFIAAWAKPNADNTLQQKLKIPAGAVLDQVANVCDLFPTITEVVGADIPADHIVDGVSMRNLLAGGRDEARSESFLMHYPHSPHRSNYFTSLREGDWKVIYHYFPSEESEGSHYQLYNLAADPFESRNLATSRADVLETMMQQLADALRAHDAVYPIADPDDPTPVLPKMP
jgi:arylsulfatase A-like enzyme